VLSSTRQTFSKMPRDFGRSDSLMMRSTCCVRRRANASPRLSTQSINYGFRRSVQQPHISKYLTARCRPLRRRGFVDFIRSGRDLGLLPLSDRYVCWLGFSSRRCGGCDHSTQSDQEIPPPHLRPSSKMTSSDDLTHALSTKKERKKWSPASASATVV
jgi:hypothetical protein